MRRAIPAMLVAALLAHANASVARAQFLLGPVYPAGYGTRLGYGGGLGFSYHHHGVRIAGFASGFYSRSVFAAPIGPILPPISTLTPFGWSPGFLPAGWGAGPGWGSVIAPPVIIVPPPIVLAGGNAGERRDDEGNPALAFEQLPKPIDPLPRGARPGQFLVISPNKQLPEPGKIARGVDRVAALPRPRSPEFRFDPFARPVKVVAEPREADPVKESARLVKLGRAAFAAGEYGQAAEQFERAITADPKSASAHFLKAHAAFAAGRYADAVTAIRAGLDRDPAWPAGTFDPKEPYGANAETFAMHLADLRQAAAANPNEPTLAFLLGYQLWFVGEKAEAKKWFDLAGKRLKDAGVVGLFSGPARVR